MIESVKQIASMTWSMMCKYGLPMADGNNSSHTLTSVDISYIKHVFHLFCSKDAFWKQKNGEIRFY